MYILYNHDGSVKTKNFNEIINQGSTGVTEIFVSIAGYGTNQYTAIALFKLPTGITTSLVGVTKNNYEIDGKLYAGYIIKLTENQTAYPGNIETSIVLTNGDNERLTSTQVTLFVNETPYVPSEVTISVAQYENLIEAMSYKVDKEYVDRRVPKVVNLQNDLDQGIDIADIIKGEEVDLNSDTVEQLTEFGESVVIGFAAYGWDVYAPASITTDTGGNIWFFGIFSDTSNPFKFWVHINDDNEGTFAYDDF